VSARPAWRGLIVGCVARPPARHRLPADGQGFGQPDQIGQDVLEHLLVERVAAAVAVQQVGADAGQAADEVVLPQRRQPPGVDPLVRPL